MPKINYLRKVTQKELLSNCFFLYLLYYPLFDDNVELKFKNCSLDRRSVIVSSLLLIRIIKKK